MRPWEEWARTLLAAFCYVFVFLGLPALAGWWLRGRHERHKERLNRALQLSAQKADDHLS
jgi:hypothetical protein